MPRHSFTRAHTVCQCVSYLSNHAERIITVASSYSHIVDVTNVNRNDEHNDAGRRIRKEKKRKEDKTHISHTHTWCVCERGGGSGSGGGWWDESRQTDCWWWASLASLSCGLRQCLSRVYLDWCIQVFVWLYWRWYVKWSERKECQTLLSRSLPPIPSHISFIQALQHTFVCLQLLSSYSNSSFCFSSSSQFSHLHRLWKIWM